MGHVRAWLPQGIWIDFFTGRVYDGLKGRMLDLYRNDYEFQESITTVVTKYTAFNEVINRVEKDGGTIPADGATAEDGADAEGTEGTEGTDESTDEGEGSGEE